MATKTSEKIIKRMRNRKRKIITLTIVLILLSTVTTFKIHAMLEFLPSVFLEPSPQADHIHFELMSTLSNALILACVYSSTLLSCAIIGLLAALLIGEITRHTNDYLLVEMWDKLKELEKKINNTT